LKTKERNKKASILDSWSVSVTVRTCWIIFFKCASQRRQWIRRNENVLWMKVNVSFLFVNLLHNFLGKYLCQHEMLF